MTVSDTSTCPRCGHALVRSDDDGYVAKCSDCQFCAFDSTRRYSALPRPDGGHATKPRAL